MIEREGDDRGVEPRVERVEHALAHRHAVVALEHGRRVGEQHRDRVAAPDAALGQRRCEPPRARVELAVAAPQRAVDDRRVVGKDGGRALEKSERRQRLIVGRIAVKIDVVWRFRHSACPPLEDVSEDKGGQAMRASRLVRSTLPPGQRHARPGAGHPRLHCGPCVIAQDVAGHRD